MTTWVVDVWGETDPGQTRSENQDSIFVASKKLADLGNSQLKSNGHLLAVADGVGGQVGGREASQFVVESLADGYYAMLSRNIVEHLRNAIERANAQAQEQVTSKFSATTLVAAVIDGNKLHIANVGDSRAYLVRNGTIQQLTRDHVLNGRLMRYMVALASVEPEFADEIELRSDDRILLCSDGLYKAIQDIREIGRIAATYSPRDAVRKLIDMANDNGGPDNISAVIAQVKTARTGLSLERIGMWASGLVP